jgi:hypothetical protein
MQNFFILMLVSSLLLVDSILFYHVGKINGIKSGANMVINSIKEIFERFIDE